MVMDCLEVVVQQCSVNMVLKGMRKVPYAVSVGGTWLSFLAVGAQGRGRYVCRDGRKKESDGVRLNRRSPAGSYPSHVVLERSPDMVPDA
jgi:hypothetical protein